LNFVEDILAIGPMLKLVLCFHSSRKSLVFGFVKRLEKQQLSVVWASPRRAHYPPKAFSFISKVVDLKCKQPPKGFDRVKRNLVLSHEPYVKTLQ
jgi:hypothetical protein